MIDDPTTSNDASASTTADHLAVSRPAGTASPSTEALSGPAAPDATSASSSQEAVLARLGDGGAGADRARPRAPARTTAKKHVILFLAANPSATDRLALDREARAIHHELKRSGLRDRFDLQTRWAAEPLDLLRELRELKPTILHFSGHGVPRGKEVGGSPHRRDVASGDVASGSEERGLQFHSAVGDGQLVLADAIARTLEAVGSSVRLVVLNACYSTWIADALLVHVDCVVGMSGSILDDAARTFAVGFYGALGHGESMARAYRQGCAAVGLEGMSEGDKPRLRVRSGNDADQLVLAYPSSEEASQASRHMKRGLLSFAGLAIVILGVCLRFIYRDSDIAGALRDDNPATHNDTRHSAASRPDPHCPIGMVRVPSGTFTMGENAATQTHIVTLSGYCIDETEVTAAEYAACVQARKCNEPTYLIKVDGMSDAFRDEWKGFCNRLDRADLQAHPINCVDWHEAFVYCEWAHKQLPTEAEWEYAARGDDGRIFPWGSDSPTEKRLNACGAECVRMAQSLQKGTWHALYEGDDGWGATAPVGRFEAGISPFGALDMAGNVWEWTADSYEPYPPGPVTDPRGGPSSPSSSPPSDKRVARGGGWYTDERAHVHSAYRWALDPTDRHNGVGFRCVRRD